MRTKKIFFAGKYYSIYRKTLGIISIAALFLFFASCDVNDSDRRSDCPCNNADSIGVWKFLGLADERVTSIAIHPTKPNIILAGTSSDFSAGIPGRLYMSFNCAKTWELKIESASYSFTDIQFNTNNPDIIFCVPYGIMCTTNGGVNWNKSENGLIINVDTRINKIELDPTNPKIIYAGASGFFGGTLYKTTNGGIDWFNLYKSENETPGLLNGITSIRIDKSNTNVLYVGTADEGILVKSLDGGNSFFKTGQNKYGAIVHDILIDENNSSIIYIANDNFGFFRSINSGASFETINIGIPDSILAVKLLKHNNSNEIYGLTTIGDSGWIMKTNTNMINWLRYGIEKQRVSYYYSDIKITADMKYIYFGTTGGIFRIRLF
ncbi:MAG: hypothetical protein IT276_00760 [Ignavibacteriaceae bacterium]|nr:hypothetical protein [Ignavibacteriaceae bacterium]